MLIYGIGFMSVTIGLAIAAAFGTVAQGKVIEKAIEGVARQPEARGTVMTLMIIGLALIESIVIYSFAMSFLVLSDLESFHADEALAAADEVAVVEIIEEP